MEQIVFRRNAVFSVVFTLNLFQVSARVPVAYAGGDDAAGSAARIESKKMLDTRASKAEAEKAPGSQTVDSGKSDGKADSKVEAKADGKSDAVKSDTKADASADCPQCHGKDHAGMSAHCDRCHGKMGKACKHCTCKDAKGAGMSCANCAECRRGHAGAAKKEKPPAGRDTPITTDQGMDEKGPNKAGM